MSGTGLLNCRPYLHLIFRPGLRLARTKRRLCRACGLNVWLLETVWLDLLIRLVWAR